MSVLKEFAGPEDTEQAAFLWDSLSDPPPIKSDAEVDPEPGKALAAAPANRREYGYRVTPGTLCPHCSRSLRVTAVRHIDESGFDIICESCHADIIRAERREAGWSHGPGTMTMRFIEHAPELVLLGPSNHLMRA